MFARLFCVVAFLFTIFCAMHYTDDVYALNKMKDVNAKARDLLIALLDAETGQRGYIITGNPEYLAPYSAGISAIRERLDALSKDLTDTVQTRAEADLRSLSLRKLEELKKTVALRDKSQADAVAEVNRHIGKSLMDQIRQALNTIELWAADRFETASSDAVFYARFGFMAMILSFMSGAYALFRRQ